MQPIIYLLLGNITKEKTFSGNVIKKYKLFMYFHNFKLETSFKTQS